jgi:hypothetical protein
MPAIMSCSSTIRPTRKPHPRYGLGARNFRRAIAEGAELILQWQLQVDLCRLGKARDVPVIEVAARHGADDTGATTRPNLFKIERAGSNWQCTLREYGSQRLSLISRLSVRIYQPRPEAYRQAGPCGREWRYFEFVNNRPSFDPATEICPVHHGPRRHLHWRRWLPGWDAPPARPCRKASASRRSSHSFATPFAIRAWRRGEKVFVDVYENGMGEFTPATTSSASAG